MPSGRGGTLRSALESAHEVLPLDPTAATALLAERLPSLTERTRARILDEAQGYPLALLELPTALAQRRREPDDGLAAALPLSARLQELFRARVAELPDATRRLLLLAALDGTGELSVLEAVTRGRGLADLEPAEHGRLVHADPDSGRLRFRHPLTRAAIVELATLQERREVHRLIAGMVTDPERKARHLADAADGPDDAVAARLEDAGRRMARRGDGHGAVAAMVRAAALSRESAERSRRLAEAACVGVNLTWNLAQAAELLADAHRAAPEIVSALPAVSATAFLYLNGDGDVDAALRLLVDTVERLSGELDAADDDVVALLSQLHLACLYAGRTEPWHVFRAALDRLRPAVPDDLCMLNASADPARAGEIDLALLAAAIVTLDAETDPLVVGRIAGTAHSFDLIAGCRTALEHAISKQIDAGATASAVSLLSALWRDTFLSGDWDGVVAMSEKGTRLCADVGSVIFSHSFRLARAFVAAGRGEAAVLDAAAGQVTAWAMTHRAMALHYVSLYSRALGAIGHGDYADAYEQLVQITSPGQIAPFRPIAMLSCMDLVEAAARTGRQAEAAAHAVAVQELDLARLSPHLALLAAGAVASGECVPAAAFRLFDEALATPGASDWPFTEARIRLAYGERLRRSRASARARPELAAALDAFEQLGARPWAERALHELQATGVPLTVPPPGPATGAVLTSHERRSPRWRRAV